MCPPPTSQPNVNGYVPWSTLDWGFVNTKERMIVMSKKETERRTIASSVMKMAHDLWRKGLCLAASWSSLLKLCWRTIRHQIKQQVAFVKGVSFSNRDGTSRQYLLLKLSATSSGKYWLKVTREADNPFDSSAQRVEAINADGSIVQLGYLPKELAKELAQDVKTGKELIVTDFTIARNMGGLYGIKLYFVCI